MTNFPVPFLFVHYYFLFCGKASSARFEGRQVTKGKDQQGKLARGAGPFQIPETLSWEVYFGNGVYCPHGIFHKFVPAVPWKNDRCRFTGSCTAWYCDGLKFWTKRKKYSLEPEHGIASHILSTYSADFFFIHESVFAHSCRGKEFS